MRMTCISVNVAVSAIVCKILSYVYWFVNNWNYSCPFLSLFLEVNCFANISMLEQDIPLTTDDYHFWHHLHQRSHRLESHPRWSIRRICHVLEYRGFTLATPEALISASADLGQKILIQSSMKYYNYINLMFDSGTKITIYLRHKIRKCYLPVSY